MAERPTWKDVFNGEHHWWGHVDACKHAALASRYPYFAFNGLVYETRAVSWRSGDLICKVSDLDARLASEAEVPTDNLLLILKALVSLKDGPRDKTYEDLKPAVWELARMAIEKAEA